MGTSIRPEVSKKNKYWIEKHRYYELKHFCLQYNVWKTERDVIDGYFKPTSVTEYIKANNISDPTEKCVEKREYYQKRISLIERTAGQVGGDLSAYILLSVTKGIPYETLRLKYDVPCCRDTFYDKYRQFFWVLDKLRG